MVKDSDLTLLPHSPLPPPVTVCVCTNTYACVLHTPTGILGSQMCKLIPFGTIGEESGQHQTCLCTLTAPYVYPVVRKAPLTVHREIAVPALQGGRRAGQHQPEGQGLCLLSFCSCFPGSSFSDLGSAKLEQRPLSQPGGISTNPFMVSASPWYGAWPLTLGLGDRILLEDGDVGWNLDPFLIKFCLVQARDVWSG